MKCTVTVSDRSGNGRVVDVVANETLARTIVAQRTRQEREKAALAGGEPFNFWGYFPHVQQATPAETQEILL